MNIEQIDEFIKFFILYTMNDPKFNIDRFLTEAGKIERERDIHAPGAFKLRDGKTIKLLQSGTHRVNGLVDSFIGHNYLRKRGSKFWDYDAINQFINSSVQNKEETLKLIAQLDNLVNVNLQKEIGFSKKRYKKEYSQTSNLLKAITEQAQNREKLFIEQPKDYKMPDSKNDNLRQSDIETVKLKDVKPLPQPQPQPQTEIQTVKYKDLEAQDDGPGFLSELYHDISTKGISKVTQIAFNTITDEIVSLLPNFMLNANGNLLTLQNEVSDYARRRAKALQVPLNLAKNYIANQLLESTRKWFLSNGGKANPDLITEISKSDKKFIEEYDSDVPLKTITQKATTFEKAKEQFFNLDPTVRNALITAGGSYLGHKIMDLLNSPDDMQAEEEEPEKKVIVNVNQNEDVKINEKLNIIEKPLVINVQPDPKIIRENKENKERYNKFIYQNTENQIDNPLMVLNELNTQLRFLNNYINRTLEKNPIFGEYTKDTEDLGKRIMGDKITITGANDYTAFRHGITNTRFNYDPHDGIMNQFFNDRELPPNMYDNFQQR